jgi:ABC-type uncharacterized transport system ATPase subunit
VVAPPAELQAELLAVDGVSAVEISAGVGDVVTAACQVESRNGVEAAIARAVAARWDLHRLERQQPTLENVFLRYVAGPPADGERG